MSQVPTTSETATVVQGTGTGPRPAPDQPALEQSREPLLRRVAPGLSRGDLGPVPVIVALLIIGVVFQLANSNYLTPRNLFYLSLQAASLSMYALGAFIVLLMGEIDLSIGSVGGFTSAVLAILCTNDGWRGGWGIVAALALGAAIGAVQGLWVVVVRAPSFIVTLPGLLVWQGMQFLVLGVNGEVTINNPFVGDIASTQMSHTVGLSVAIVVALGFAAYTAAGYLLRRRGGYQQEGAAASVARAAVVAAAAIGVTVVLNQFLGVPTLLVMIVLVTAVFGVVTSSTPYGTHIYAVGGNAEAARRAGVRMGSLRVSVFVLVGMLAAVGGIIDASRGLAVTVNAGGGNTTLDAIAAAVIGGTSLFGGRGRASGALLGAFVIAAVANGLDLLGQSAAMETIVTGLILLAAVSIDVTSRRVRIGLPRSLRRGT
jgi:D-xylose transport system permease protein